MLLSVVDFNRDFEKDLIWREEQDFHYRLVGIYYPSELTFPCRRNHVLRYLYPNKKYKDGDTLLRFQHGLLLEEWFTRRLRESRYWEVLGAQESVAHKEGDAIFMGRRDVRAYSYHRQQVFSIEVKKAGPYWTYKGKPIYPKPEHLLQSNFYLENTPNGLLVYVNPFLEIKEFSHVFDPDKFQEVVNRGVQCHSHLMNGTLPEPEPQHWNRKVCDYCLWREECKR